jgi:DNA polymerase-3 subunit alpha
MKVNSTTWLLEDGQFVGNECAFPLGGVMHGCKQRHVNDFVVEQARRLDSPLLLTLDAHFVRPETKVVQDVLLQNGNKNGWRASSAYYQKNSVQAWDSWKENHHQIKDSELIFQEALENNSVFASMIEPISLEKKYHLPEVSFPPNITGSTTDEKLMALLMQRIRFHDRMPKEPDKVEIYLERLQKEIEVIANNGKINFLPYFLIIDIEICSFMRDSGHLVGVGRGSAAGSLLSYLLKITHLDPIRWDLSFERFLSAGRISRGKFPDIDLDFGDPKILIDHLYSIYGERFARICTTGTAKLKGAVRDVSRIILKTGENPSAAKAVDEVCETIENIPQGMDSRKWLYGYEDGEGSHPGYITLNSVLADFFKECPDIKELVDQVLDVPRSVGRHASAYCISDDPVNSIVPMCRIKGEDCTQFTMGPVEDLGLIKMDFLGLNTLNDIAGAIAIIKKRRGITIDPYQMNESDPEVINIGDTIGININDKKVYKAFCDGETATVFQFKTAVATPLCIDIRPKNLHDLAAITANGRPGTMYALMEDGKTTLIDEWRNRRQGNSPITYAHEDLESILKQTDGIFTYQESIMAAFVKCCGYSAEQADEIREFIGKKKADKMAELFPEIRAKLQTRGWRPEQTETFISLCVAASSYSFNKSHSYSYSYVGYICMWLKVNFKLEWWNSVLQNSSHDDLREAARHVHDIVIPPDINRSSLDFYVISEEKSKLMFPLNRVKNVKGAGLYIQEARDAAAGAFMTLVDFYERVDRRKVNKRVVASLIWSGAFDGMYQIEKGNTTERNNIYREYLAIKKDKDFKTFVDLSPTQIIRIQMELLAIGSTDLLTIIEERVNKKITPLHLLDRLSDKTLVSVGGMVSSLRTFKTKTGKNPGQTMAFVDLENNGAVLSITVFPDQYAAFKDEMKEGFILCVDGSVNRYKGKVGLVAGTVLNIKDEFEELNPDKEETDSNE